MTRVSDQVAKNNEAILDIQSPSLKRRKTSGIEIAGGKRGKAQTAAIVGIFALVAVACIVGL